MREGLRRALPGALTPRLVLGLTLAYLALAWLLFFAIDVANAFGLRDALAASPLATPILWYHLFTEGGVTELLQWLALAALAVTGGALWGRLSAGPEARSRTAGRFWLLMAVTAGLMLIEDAGNPRHRLAGYASMFLPMFAAQDARTAAELLYYAALASIPIYALLRYGRPVLEDVRARGYLLGGFAAYGLAAAASATRHMGEWYMEVGGRLHRGLLGGDLLRHYSWDQELLEFYLMDYLVEESVELLGAAALLAAAAACLERVFTGETRTPPT